MEENQETTPLDVPSFDYNKLEELKGNQEKLNQLLEEILTNQKELNDYIIPTEEEIKQQQLNEKKLHEEQEKQKEEMLIVEQEEQEQVKKEKAEQQEYNQEILYELKTLNENIGKVEFLDYTLVALLFPF